MANKPMNLNGSEGENHEIGRKLYNQEHHQNQQQGQRYGYRGTDTRQWGEGNYFHTGPNPRGAQDSPQRKYGDNYQHDRNSSYAQGRNAHLNDHYGSESMSSYRNERDYIDHGDRGNYQHSQQHSMRRPHTSGDALENRGNRYDVNDYQNDQWREGPGSRSRYKEDDYRYGSGSHNWYREGRYTPDNDASAPHPRDNRGFMDRMKDTWNDIWHSDDANYRQRNRHESPTERTSSRGHHGYESYRDRNFDRGFEGGPRWADEVDSGDDNYYNDINRNQRWRR
ncbi:hypothetical protein [Pontibacter actiniarum]|uniref:Uncharacterized protein n=1 Tax=Pontibacter actiniarum TaxID=323450 RepID=A0A1X9YVA3_9BACT|nr:hypothetical protein [Pontibacter actiniarum]ARS36773.1 hypothetical protein CA264_15840 [Pontibacter actiniarum]